MNRTARTAIAATITTALLVGYVAMLRHEPVAEVHAATPPRLATATADAGTPLVERRPGASIGTRAPTRAEHARVAPIGVNGSLISATGIGAEEVTVARFRACVDAGACKAEQFLADAGTPCNWGVAGRDDHPMNCVDWHGADAFCRFDGGRLCRDAEWFGACRGPQDRDYPYGGTFDGEACLARPGPPTAGSGTEVAGSRSTCVGGSAGIYDLTGNVSEWVDDCNDNYCHFYGGAYLTNQPVEDFASCKHVCAGNQKEFRSATIGIRCCYDQIPPGR